VTSAHHPHAARPQARAEVRTRPAAPSPWIVAIDVGGSGSRLAAVRLAAGADERRAGLAGRPVAVGPGGSDVAAVVHALGAAFAAARSDADGEPPVVVAAAVGATGVATLVPDPAAVHDALRTSLGAGSTAVAADALTAHLGALGGRAGAVVAAGTGAIALGTDLGRIWQRVDGWGHLLGDLGSASWIGARGLRAALAAHDHRPTATSPALLRAATARFGPVQTWPAQLYTRHDRAQVLGSFTPDVAAAASDGDAAARQILAAAGTHLAESLAAALVPDLPPRAAATGGVLAAGPALTTALAHRFATLRPDAELLPCAGTPLDGALHLARRLAGSAARGPDGAARTSPHAGTVDPLVAHAPWLSINHHGRHPAARGTSRPTAPTPTSGDPT